jgi:alpha 1,3-glucosidase
MVWTHPSEESGFAVDDQLFVGTTGLLAKPIVEKDKFSTDIWIPDDEIYFDYTTYQVLKTQKGKRVTVNAAIDAVPLLMRGGHIFPRRDTPRRSSAAMRFDDYTLVVTISKDGSAEGDLYADDGDTFDNEKGQYIYRKFSLANNILASTDAEGRDVKTIKAGSWLKSMREVRVDRIIIVGAPASLNVEEVQITSEGTTWGVKVDYHAAEKDRAAFAVLGRVGAKISEDWSIGL